MAGLSPGLAAQGHDVGGGHSVRPAAQLTHLVAARLRLGTRASRGLLRLGRPSGSVGTYVRCPLLLRRGPRSWGVLFGPLLRGRRPICRCLRSALVALRWTPGPLRLGPDQSRTCGRRRHGLRGGRQERRLLRYERTAYGLGPVIGRRRGGPHGRTARDAQRQEQQRQDQREGPGGEQRGGQRARWHRPTVLHPRAARRAPRVPSPQGGTGEEKLTPGNARSAL